MKSRWLVKCTLTDLYTTEDQQKKSCDFSFFSPSYHAVLLLFLLEMFLWPSVNLQKKKERKSMSMMSSYEVMDQEKKRHNIGTNRERCHFEKKKEK